MQRRVPQLVYTNKIGDCLFICLFIYLSICSAIGGQTARPKRLKFGRIDVKSPDDECGLGAVGLKRHLR